MGAFMDERAVGTWNGHSGSAASLPSNLRAIPFSQGPSPLHEFFNPQRLRVPGSRGWRVDSLPVCPAGAARDDLIERGGDVGMR